MVACKVKRLSSNETKQDNLGKIIRGRGKTNKQELKKTGRTVNGTEKSNKELMEILGFFLGKLAYVLWKVSFFLFHHL